MIIGHVIRLTVDILPNSAIIPKLGKVVSMILIVKHFQTLLISALIAANKYSFPKIIVFLNRSNQARYTLYRLAIFSRGQQVKDHRHHHQGKRGGCE